MVTVCRSACDSGDQMMETKWASGSRDPFLNFRSPDVFGMDEARFFKFSVCRLIKFRGIGVYSGSGDLSKI